MVDAAVDTIRDYGQAYISLSVILCASFFVAKVFERLSLPKITAYIATGAIAGPHVLKLLTSDDISRLLPINYISISFIAFVAASELEISSIKHHLRAILACVAADSTLILILTFAVFFGLSYFIGWASNITIAERVAMALLVAVLMIARSPSSLIAVINELKARGPFTSTCLGVTMVTDVLVIVAFALGMAVAEPLVTKSFDSAAVLGLPATLFLSLVVGLVLACVFHVVFSLTLPSKFKKPLRVMRAMVVIVTGWAVYASEVKLSRLSVSMDWVVKISAEPLLTCMIASFSVVNVSLSGVVFTYILHALAPAVYAVFFTYVGATLNLAAISSALAPALALVVIRLVGIAMGNFIGCTVSRLPRKAALVGWGGYITQAGVALGLSQEMAHLFDFGDDVLSLCITVIVINQLVGPVLVKMALKHMGETSPTIRDIQKKKKRGFIGHAVIIGRNGLSEVVADRLVRSNWHVVLADHKECHVSPTDVEVHKRVQGVKDIVAAQRREPRRGSFSDSEDMSEPVRVGSDEYPALDAVPENEEPTPIPPGRGAAKLVTGIEADQETLWVVRTDGTLEDLDGLFAPPAPGPASPTHPLKAAVRKRVQLMTQRDPRPSGIAELPQPDVVISLMSDDTLNYAVLKHAKEAGVTRLVCRVYDPQFIGPLQRIDACVVDPSTALVDMVRRFVEEPDPSWSEHVNIHSSERVLHLKGALQSLEGVPLAALARLAPADVMISGVVRQGHWLAAASGTALQEGDNLVAVGHPDSLDSFKADLLTFFERVKKGTQDITAPSTPHGHDSFGVQAVQLARALTGLARKDTFRHRIDRDSSFV
ncbi:Sodium/hydrogen exchanger family [Carpediemonas membranifera]|uniref:Sodium/hydrogen exchanger family n=1 Tax=Carpediemonas membranifera TaxID=201153 RepID=A0A8J6B4X5_9EUKA|nr:Sodium/hydrogen exchanger family [Carpediemonas membranifera]|eukprot:KAG9393089.1 Sodium/hydrogen exchanger family [Carpediemonas membranifera]